MRPTTPQVEGSAGRLSLMGGINMNLINKNKELMVMWNGK